MHVCAVCACLHKISQPLSTISRTPLQGSTGSYPPSRPSFLHILQLILKIHSMMRDIGNTLFCKDENHHLYSSRTSVNNI